MDGLSRRDVVHLNAAIYGGWVALALGYHHLSPAVALPCAIFLTAWHSSLQHETIHAMRRVPARIREVLATPSLGVFYPYEWYRSEHARHHAIAGTEVAIAAHIIARYREAQHL